MDKDMDDYAATNDYDYITSDDYNINVASKTNETSDDREDYFGMEDLQQTPRCSKWHGSKA